MPKYLKIVPLRWESEASQLNFGEILFADTPTEITREREKYDYIVARLRTDEPDFCEKAELLMSEGFGLSDVFLVIEGDISKIRKFTIAEQEDRVTVFGNHMDEELREEIIKMTISRLRFSRYFTELPSEIAERIYRRWIGETIERGIAFAVLRKLEKGHRLEGFLGCTIENEKAKNFILFSERMSYILLIKSLLNKAVDIGTKRIEFKISMKNQKGSRTILKLLRNIDYRTHVEITLRLIRIK